jgi:hypothetical protein
MHNVECNTFLAKGLNRYVFYYVTGIGFYSRQWIDVDKVMKNNNLLIRHKHDKEIYMIQRFFRVIMEENYLMFMSIRGRYT